MVMVMVIGSQNEHDGEVEADMLDIGVNVEGAMATGKPAIANRTERDTQVGEA